MLEECIKMFVVIGFLLLWISLDSLHSVSLSSFYTAFSEQEPHEIRVKENDWNGNGKEKRRKKLFSIHFFLFLFPFVPFSSPMYLLKALNALLFETSCSLQTIETLLCVLYTQHYVFIWCSFWKIPFEFSIFYPSSSSCVWFFKP